MFRGYVNFREGKLNANRQYLNIQFPTTPLSVISYLGLSPLPVTLANEGLGWDPLLKNIYIYILDAGYPESNEDSRIKEMFEMSLEMSNVRNFQSILLKFPK